MRIIIALIGLLLILLTCWSILLTMVLPRRPGFSERPSMAVLIMVRWFFVTLSRIVRKYETKDTILAPMGPIALVAQLVVWAALLDLGFSLVLVRTTHNFVNALTQASASMFTVGTAHVGGPRNYFVDITVGAIWVVVVALQIAYLPALYASFNRRESLVALLESRSGLPAWGPEILIRHELVKITDTLPEFYSSWESWSGELAESHTTYPALLLFRSPESGYSWVVSLLAVMDAAALEMALAPSTVSSNARLSLRMGFTALNRIARSQGWKIDLDPNPDGPIALSFGEFETAVELITSSGFVAERSAAEAWSDFVGWRVNYETNAYRLAELTMAPVAPWSGPRKFIKGPVENPHRPPHRRPSKSR